MSKPPRWTFPDDPDLSTVSNEPAGDPIRHAFSRVPQKPAASWRVMPKGSGSYHARFVLSALGGSFDAKTKTWSLPPEMAPYGEDACTLGAQRMRDLDFTDPDVQLICDDAGVPMARRRSRATPSQTPQIAEPDRKWLRACWECGGPLTERNAIFAVTPRKHANAEEAYCGCVDRGDAKKRHRPNFRAGI